MEKNAYAHIHRHLRLITNTTVVVSEAEYYSICIWSMYTFYIQNAGRLVR